MTKPKKVKPVTYKAWGYLDAEGHILQVERWGEALVWNARAHARHFRPADAKSIVRLTVTVKVEA